MIPSKTLESSPQWAWLLKHPAVSLPATDWALLYEELGRYNDYLMKSRDELQAAWGSMRKEVISQYEDAFSEGGLDLQTELRARFP